MKRTAHPALRELRDQTIATISYDGGSAIAKAVKGAAGRVRKAVRPDSKDVWLQR